MAPLLDIQRRAYEIGRIRLGVQVPTKNGRSRPEKLSTFRFTTASRRVAEAVAVYLGGQVARWEGAPAGEQWEVITTATELPVAVPPGDAAVSQWYEMWSGGGCQRRCDGVTEQLTQKPCLCPADPHQRAAAATSGGACKPTTRVNVMIPDLPGVGLFRVESHGFYAAVELGGAAELLAAARSAGVIVPAVLRLEQRQVKRAGQTRNFAVPVLEILPTLREMTQLQAGAGGLAAALPPAPGLAITAAPTPAVQPAQRRALEALAADGTPQDLAAKALQATTRADLVDLGKVARARDWLADMVEGPGGAYEPLGDLIMGCLADVDRATATEAQAPEPPAAAGDPATQGMGQW